MICTKRDGSFTSASCPTFSAQKQVCAAGVNADAFHVVWALLQPAVLSPPVLHPLGNPYGVWAAKV